jgi:hypothetical protein
MEQKKLDLDREVLVALMPAARAYAVARIIDEVKGLQSPILCFYAQNNRCLNKSAQKETPGDHCFECLWFARKKHLPDVYIIRTLEKLAKRGLLLRCELEGEQHVAGKKTKKPIAYRIHPRFIERTSKMADFTINEDEQIVYKGKKYVQVFP